MIYIVEIPHQRPASAWSAFDQEDAISRITSGFNTSNYCWTRYDSIDALPYDREEPDERTRYAEAVDIISKHGAVVEFWNNVDLELAAPDKAESEYDYWMRVNGDDLNSQLVFDSAKEALEWLAFPESGNRHQGLKARSALKRELERNHEAPSGVVTDEEGDEEEIWWPDGWEKTVKAAM